MSDDPVMQMLGFKKMVEQAETDAPVTDAPLDDAAAAEYYDNEENRQPAGPGVKLKETAARQAAREKHEAAKKATREQEQAFSRDVITEAIRDGWKRKQTAEQMADTVIKALAYKHLHIFKSRGSEL